MSRQRLLRAAAICAAAFVVSAPASSRAQSWGFITVMRTGDPVPGGNGTFVDIPSEPCATPRGSVVFRGLGSMGENGVYAVALLPEPCFVVADLSSAIPGGAGTFTDFGGAAIGEDLVVFRGFGSNGQDGIYGHDASAPEPCFLVANDGSAVPGGNATFLSFGGVAADGDGFAYYAMTTAGEGIYARSSRPIPCFLVADTATPIPGGQLGGFTSFEPTPCFDQGDVGFQGFGANGYAGLFLHDGVNIVRLVDTQENVPGGNGTFAEFAQVSLGAGSAAFHAYGTMGEEGIYVAGPVPCFLVADLATPIPGGQGTFQGFEGVAYDGESVAFVGLGSKAIYSNVSGQLERVIGVGDVLDGGTIADLSIGSAAYAGGWLAFRATFTNNTAGIFVAGYPDPNSVGGATPAPGRAVSAHPNPFLASTMLHYSIPRDGIVEIAVYDAAGALVARPVAGEWRVAGSNVVRLALPRTAAGVYWATIRSGGVSASAKIVALR